MDDNNKGITRRNFLKASMAVAAYAAIPVSTGCSTAGYKNIPDLKYQRDLILNNAKIVNVVDGSIIENGSVLIRDGIISEVREEPFVSDSVLTVNCQGKYVIPGLIDAHCHSTMSPVFSVDAGDLFKHIDQQKKNLNQCIEHGVTTIRDVGALPISLRGLIKDVESGAVNGPRILYCNSIININGGHPDIDPTDVSLLAGPLSLFTGDIAANFKNMKELKRSLEENAENASLIKLTVDNKSVFCKKGEIPAYTDEHYAKIMDFAEKKELPVSCHCHYKYGFDHATRYPINSLEHVVTDDLLTDKEVQLMVDRNVAIVPTMTIAASMLMEEAYETIPAEFMDDFVEEELRIRRDYFSKEAVQHFDGELHRKNMNYLKKYREVGRDKLVENHIYLVNPDIYFNMMRKGRANVDKMRQAGVLIGCGIDAGMPFAYFGGLYRELELFSRMGFSSLEVLQTATINNAKILKMENRLGSIDKGKYADIVLLDNNPLTDVSCYRDPSMVIKEGKLVHSSNEVVKSGQVLCAI